MFTILTTGILLFCSPQYPQKLELSLILSKGLNEYGLGEELTVDSKFQACLYHGRQRELGPVLAPTAWETLWVVRRCCHARAGLLPGVTSVKSHHGMGNQVNGLGLVGKAFIEQFTFLEVKSKRKNADRMFNAPILQNYVRSR